MSRLIDLSGKRFGRWTVVRRAARVGGHTFWHCVCDCGNHGDVYARSLTNQASTSCGCYMREVFTNFKHGHTAEGVTSKEYSTWNVMRQRCSDPKHRAYKWYGGRGIAVCERWRTFDNFIADMGLCPDPKWTIDRIDSNGNYEPSNCRWASWAVQAANKRPRKSVAA